MGTTLTGTKKGNNIHGDINFNNNTLFVSSSGNIGIGTTSPAYKLTVDGNIQLPSGGFIYGQSTGNYLKLDNATYVELGYSSTTAIRADGSDVTIRGVGGTANMTIESGGNVGIGTTSPSAKLDVVGKINIGGSNSPVLNLKPTSSSGISQIIFENADTTAVLGRVAYDITSNSMRLHTANTERIRIATDGKVGIGTTSPQYPLHINNGTGDQSALFESTDVTNTIGIKDSNSTSINTTGIGVSGDDLFLYAGSTAYNQRLRIQGSTGNVGIGITTPADKLHVYGNQEGITIQQSTSGNVFNGINFEDYNGVSNAGIKWNQSTGEFRLNTSTSYYPTFYANGSEAMRITTAGNVGIGTTSPATKIDVDGTGRITDTVYLSTNANSKVGIGTFSPVSKLHIIHTDASLDTLRVGRSDNSSYWRVNHAGNDFRLFNVDTSGADILFGVDSGGFIQNNRVGIQVANPTAQLHISSSGTPFKMERGGYDTYGFVQSTGNGLQVQNFTDARTEMFFKGDGTVGIGTTSPSAKLEINDTTVPTLMLKRGTDTGYALISGSSGLGFEFKTYSAGEITAMKIANDGNVGIGTTSPSDKLQVDGRIRIKSNSGLYIDTSATYGASSAANFEVINDASSNPVLRILNAGNGGFRNISISTYSGKLGIGTLNPTEKLTVEGNISASGDLDVTGNITTTGAVKLDGVDGLYFNQGSTSTSSPTPGIFYSGTSGQGWYFQVPNNGQEKFSFKLGSTDVNREFRVVDPSWNPLFQVQGTGDAIIANNLTVGGTVTAQEFHTEFVSASIIYQSGSTKFGDTADDIHSFTGSLEVSASIKMTGDGHAYTYPLEITSDSIKLPSNNASSRSIIRQAGAGTGAFLSLRNGSGDERVMIRSYDSGGVQAFFTAGNVGIGTTSPSQKLQVTTGINDGFKVSNNTNSSYTSIQNFSSGPVLNMYDSNPVNTVRIRSYASSGVQAYFTAGNVGIGTTSPSSKLHVSGAADVLLIEGSGSTANTSIFAIDGNNGRLFEVSDDLSDSLFSVNTIAGLPVVEVFADNRVTMGAFNQNDFVISGSKIGIGTSAPVSLLTLEGTVGGDPMLRLKSTGTTTSEDAYMAFNRDNTNTQGYTIGLDSGDNSFKISEDGDSITGNNRVTILTGGNVGIGTTSPQRLFDVNGDVRVKRNIYGADGNYIGFFVDSGSAIPIKARSLALTTDFNNEAPTNGLYVQGDVGIGTTTPQLKLHISGSTGADSGIRQSRAGVKIWDQQIDSSGRLIWSHYASEGGSANQLLTLDDSNRVGIGTTSPSTALHIATSTSGGNPSVIIQDNVRGQTGTLNYVAFTDAAGSTQAKVGHQSTLNGTFTVTNTIGDITLDSTAQITLDATSNLIVQTAGSTAIKVDNTGKVGIGTTSPSHTLDIVQVADNQGLKISGFDDQSGQSYSQYVDQNGHITLVASSGANLNYTVQNGHFNVNLSTSTKDFRVKDSGGTTVLNVTGDSKVGIGTQSPAETLHLSGSMRIDGAGTGAVQEQEGTPTLAYTSNDPNYYMGEPDRYLKIVLDGTTYLIPAYTPA